METRTKLSRFSKEIGKDLLNIGSVKLDIEKTFTWVSGIKSPVYCDNRLVNSDVVVRKNVINAFVDLIKDHFPTVEIITGIVTGGIPFGVLIADRMDLPFIYVRQEKKEYGLKKQVEGYFEEGNKVVVIEDHVSTGKSSLKAIDALREEGLEILGLVSIMTYNFEKAIHLFDSEKINYYSLSDLDTVLDVALDSGKITPSEKESILKFRDDPEKWGINK